MLGVPASVIAPAVLFEELELFAVEDEPQRLPIVPAPHQAKPFQRQASRWEDRGLIAGPSRPAPRPSTKDGQRRERRPAGSSRREPSHTPRRSLSVLLQIAKSPLTSYYLRRRRVKKVT